MNRHPVRSLYRWHVWRVFVAVLILCSPAWAAEYHGQVLFGGLPVPGARVTATAKGSSISVITDDTGVYRFPDLADGKWTVKVEMTGFAPLQQEITVPAQGEPPSSELKLMPVDELRRTSKLVKPDSTTGAGSGTAATLPPPSTAPATGKNQPPQGANTAAAPMVEAPLPAPEASPNNSDGLLINGSVNNASTSQYALSQAFGNNRNGGRRLYNGGLSLVYDNSALDARQYSLTGITTPKPSTENLVLGLNFGGPIRIPHLLLRGPNFFIGYQRVRNSTDNTVSALVPTLAERNGDFSGALDTTGHPIVLYNPATGKPFSGPVGPISPQALALLRFYPLPNVVNPTYNYQAPLVSSSHQDAFQLRLDKSFRRDQFFGFVALQNIHASSASLFGFVDRTNTLGLNSNINWSHRLAARVFVTQGYQFSRSRNQITPHFEGITNVSALAGITGNDQDPADWGPPGLSFSSGIVGLNDAQSAYNRSETNGWTGRLYWNRQKHTIQIGADIRRQEFNYLSQANPRGTFGFTGNATAGSTSNVASSGSDFADFLLGIPDTSAIAYGNADKYLRQTVYDLFLNDDWRVRPELTINGGIRWEYGSPMTETKGRLVNLDPAAGFASIAPVLASSPVGALTGQHYPTSLLRPDRLGIEPRLGISWRPISGSTLLVKASYGVYDDTSVYQGTALAMAQQAPLSRSLSASNSAGCPLSLANGFVPCATAAAETFGVDPNFRVGYAQTWLLSMQRDLPGALQGTITYLGIKGTRGVQQFLPNTYPAGASNPCPSCPSGFAYRTSNGNSTRESGSVQLRRRLQSGLTANLTYTFSKSLDDDAVLGGQGPQATGATTQSIATPGTAQDWRNLRAERGLSNFDQRHVLTAQLQYTTGMGIGGHSLLTGWRGRAYKEWTALVNISAGTGTPETPLFPAAIGGAVCTTCMRGDYSGAPIYTSSVVGKFLNSAAFVAPPSGQWGDARVGSITGPDRFSLNVSLQRTFRLHDRFHLDVRLDSTNTLNHVTYSGWVTTINSPQFGAPAGANGMRHAQLTMRLGF